jgi:succinate dehydrogenase/fumarate reductase cytochrome b subunit
LIASLSDYLPLSDLAKIIAACLVVAVVAPAAVAIAIAGLDRRSGSGERRASPAGGLALVVVGVAILCALIGAGLYALFTD